MDNYLILTYPGHNRVYYEASKRLAIEELTVCLNKATDIKSLELCGVHYIEFSASIDDEDLKIIANLSFVYALFRKRNEWLEPIKIEKTNFIDDSINNVLKYSGKTNELFTKMLLNIAAANLECDKDKLKLLDPMAGKGTSLFEGIARGIDSYGIEIDTKSTQEAYVHCRKYLENKKYKHILSERKHSGDNKSFTAKIKTVKISRGDGAKVVWEICEADSTVADKIYKHDFFDVILTDLPYGVQHSSKIGKGAKISRTPYSLIIDCLPAWRKVLKTGGVIAISWNANVMKKESLCAALKNNGFDIICEDLELEHRVDQAILRDVVFARKIK